MYIRLTKVERRKEKQSMRKNSIVKVPRSLDDANTIVAQIIGVSDSYVRMIVNGSFTPISEEGKKRANAIRELHRQYQTGKNDLIRKLEQEIKVA